jgi:hypothetical protein
MKVVWSELRPSSPSIIIPTHTNLSCASEMVYLHFREGIHTTFLLNLDSTDHIAQCPCTWVVAWKTSRPC